MVIQSILYQIWYVTMVDEFWWCRFTRGIIFFTFYMGTWELQQFPCSGHCMWNVVVLYVIDIFCKTCTDVTSQFIGVMSVTWLTLDPGDAAPCPALLCLYVMGGINLFTSCAKLGTQHRLRGEERLGAAGTHTCKVCWEASLSNTDKYQQWKIGKLGKNWWPRTFILWY